MTSGKVTFFSDVVHGQQGAGAALLLIYYTHEHKDEIYEW